MDLPPESVSNDKRQVIRKRDVSPDVQIVDISQVCRAWDSRRTVSQGGSGKQMPLPLNILATTTSGRELDVVPRPSGSDAARWLEQWKWNSMETVRLSSPPLSGQLSPASPQAVAWECLGDSSVPLSPNRVQARLLQDIPDEGSLFHVSPISPGFFMHPSGAASPHLQTGVLLPTTLDDFSNSVLGDPITYAQCERIPRSDTPMTLPVYMYRLDSLICQVSLRFRLCWLWGPPLFRRYGPLLSLPRWIRRTARCLRRDCRAVRIGSRCIVDQPLRM